MNGISPEHITGLILAGGRASRMGGLDKGLQPHRGLALAQHALQRLRPQVGSILISANRNLTTYAALGVPVCADATADYLGPLAGLLAGLKQTTTPYLVMVPCDAPHFPHDLVGRLAAALQMQRADIATAATRSQNNPQTTQAQHVFCLVKTSLIASLQSFLQTGSRKVEAWTTSQAHAQVVFEQAAEFASANTLDELRRLSE
jgi:molybdenum cofactor guanylyltransferase